MENYHPNARQTPRLEFIYGHLTVPYLHVYAHAGARQVYNKTSLVYKYIAYQLFIHIRKHGNKIYCLFLEKEKGNNFHVFNHL